MKTFLLLFATTSVLVGARDANCLTLYVAPNGSDRWSGRLATANAEKTDGPLATPTGARDAVRKLRATGEKVPVTVLFRGGAYWMAEPLVLEPQDSGTAEGPVVYAAFENERPVFSGGRPIRGWKRGEGPLWYVDLPDVREGRWYFHQLFVNGQRRPRARTPNEFYLHMADRIYRDRSGKPEAEGSHTGFRFRKGDVRRWDHLEDVQITVFHAWYTTHHWVAEVDEQKQIVWVTSRTHRPFGQQGGPHQRYIVENYREALDAPGEWYLNRTTGRLEYFPVEGQNMETAEVFAPALKQVLRFEGDPDAGRFVDHLRFRGLSFQHCDWDLSKDNSAGLQNHRTMNSTAIFARGIRDCAFESCEIAHVGAWALWLERGCKRNRIVHCHLHDLGAGGLRIGEEGPPATDAQVTEGNVVDNNFIHDSSHVFHAGVGVWITHCPHNRVTHNEICDLDYTGISVGWRWDQQESFAHHNLIEDNHIHHLGRGVLSDMAGVYLLGISPGVVVRNNVIHDVQSYAYGGWGLYSDAFCSGVLFERNIAYRCDSGGFFQNYGGNNTVRNNVFAGFPKERWWQIGHGGGPKHDYFFNIERNIIYNENERVVGCVPRGSFRQGSGNYAFDHNLYHVPQGVTPDFAGRSFAEWQAAGQDRHSLLADPLFVNPQADDFRLRPESPAHALGFQPIDLSTVGLSGEPEWVNAPKQIRRAHLRIPPAPEPEKVEDDFENAFVGEPPLLGVVRSQPLALLVVTDETAARGKHSLKFADAPGLRFPWHPHLYYQPQVKGGRARFTFAVRLKPGAHFAHEWRDRSSPYRVGPSIAITPDGRLVAGQKELDRVPFDEWIWIEITCGIGTQAAGSYDLILTVPNQAPRRFQRVPIPGPAARELAWLGFMSLATEKAVFYLDEVKLESSREVRP